MKAGALNLPAALAKSHMPGLAELPAGTSVSIRVQLVLLPPYACDVTPDTPAQGVQELRHGVSVYRKSGKAEIFPLSGLSLTRSKPVVENWHLRGELTDVPHTGVHSLVQQDQHQHSAL